MHWYFSVSRLRFFFLFLIKFYTLKLFVVRLEPPAGEDGCYSPEPLDKASLIGSLFMLKHHGLKLQMKKWPCSAPFRFLRYSQQQTFMFWEVEFIELIGPFFKERLNTRCRERNTNVESPRRTKRKRSEHVPNFHHFKGNQQPGLFINSRGLKEVFWTFVRKKDIQVKNKLLWRKGWFVKVVKSAIFTHLSVCPEAFLLSPSIMEKMSIPKLFLKTNRKYFMSKNIHSKK